MVFGLFSVGFDAQEFGARPLGGLLARLADAFANLKSAPVPVAGFLGGIFRVQRFLLSCVGHRRFRFDLLFSIACWACFNRAILQVLFGTKTLGQKLCGAA